MNFGQDWLKPCYWTNTLKTPLCYINNVLIRVIRVTLTLPVFRSVSEIRNSETCFSSAFISYQTYYIYDSVCFHWTKISGSSCERYLMWNREKKTEQKLFLSSLSCFMNAQRSLDLDQIDCIIMMLMLLIACRRWEFFRWSVVQLLELV